MGEGQAAGVEGVAADGEAGLDGAGVGFLFVGVIGVGDELGTQRMELAVSFVELVADQRVADVGEVDAYRLVSRPSPA